VLSRFSLRACDWVMVTNDVLADRISTINNSSLVLPDPLPEIELVEPGSIKPGSIKPGSIKPGSIKPESIKFGSVELTDVVDETKLPLVTLICSFSDDEPIEEFIKGAEQCSVPHELRITGSLGRAGELVKYKSSRVSFTGFLPTEEFEFLISTSDVLVDLTTRDDCLVCGAYEALSVGVPALLSGTPALRALFKKGFVFSENNSEAYQSSLEKILLDHKKLRVEIVGFQKEFELLWSEMFSGVEAKLNTENFS